MESGKIKGTQVQVVILYLLSNSVVIDHTKCLSDFCHLQKGVIENYKIQFLLSCPLKNGKNSSVLEITLPVIKNRTQS